MSLLKLLMVSSKKSSNNAASFKRLSTSRKFSIEFDREEIILSKYEDMVLNR